MPYHRLLAFSLDVLRPGSFVRRLVSGRPRFPAADPTRIHNELGWQPTSSTLEQIITDAATAAARQ